MADQGEGFDDFGDGTVRAQALAAVVKETPKAFWSALSTGARQTYLGTFLQIQNDENILPEQRLDALLQMRHFRMEHLIHGLAQDHELPVSKQLLVKNGRAVVYVAPGAVAFTQSYVQAIGQMPKPAKFREIHAAMNAVSRFQEFNLWDEPEELQEAKAHYGIIAHNPTGRRFETDQQALGTIQLCIPDATCSGWLAELPIQEIIASYPPEKDRGGREPQWKVNRVRGQGEE